MRKDYFEIVTISLISLVVLLSGCEKEAVDDGLSGDLVGYITLQSKTDHSDVEVIVENAESLKVVKTDEDGKYVVEGLKGGVYDIVFSKEGYGQYKIQRYTFTGGSKKPTYLQNSYLYPLPDIQVNNLELKEYKVNDIIKLQATAGLSCDYIGYTYFRYYLSDQPDVSYLNYKWTDLVPHYRENQLEFCFSVDISMFPVGSDLYIIVYPAATGTAQYYDDVNTGKKIYTTININRPSNTAKITVPNLQLPLDYKM